MSDTHTQTSEEIYFNERYYTTSVHRCRSCMQLFRGDGNCCSPICIHNFLNYKIRYGENLILPCGQSIQTLPEPRCLFCGSLTNINYEYLYPPAFTRIYEYIIAICRICSLLKADVEELIVYEQAIKRGIV